MQLQPVGERLWAAEAPLRFLGMNVGRRMGVARLAGGDLFVHSPAPLGEGLWQALDALGEVRYVSAASGLHGHRFMEQYATAYPEAEMLAPPGLARRRPDLDFAVELGDETDPRLAADFDQALVRGHRHWTEVLFLHRPSRTLLVGDVVWNVTASLPFGARLWAGWRPGVRPTRPFRMGFGDRAAARDSLERVLAWDFDRILIGHGEPIETGGRQALRSAYGWLLDAGES
jgi:hypothetical protein